MSALYLGDLSMGNSLSATLTHTVPFRPATTTTLSSSPNPSNSGQAVTLTATVAPASGSGTPTGSVRFKVDGIDLYSGFFPVGPVTMSAGVATVVTSALADGIRSLTAVYSGDLNFGPSTSPVVTHVVPGRLTIDDPSANPVDGPTIISFTVTLTGAAAAPVTVDYATADRTAKAGTDYTAVTGSLTFNPGETSKVVRVSLAGPKGVGPNKDLFLVLSNPTNASLAKGTGIGTLVYVTTGAVSVYVDDPTVAEGYQGVTLLGFTLSLSNGGVSGPVKVDYTTADGTAVAGTDYTAQSGTLTFAGVRKQGSIVVAIHGNSTPGSNRTFFLNLSNAVGVAIAKAQGTGTILDDDPTPAATTVAQYRLYSPDTKEHLYTTDANEYAVLATRNWLQEGTAYTMFKDGGSYGGQYAIPLYRMYHPGILQHHWTTDANEVSTLAPIGIWNYEGIAGYVLPSAGTGTTPLYRLRLNAPPLHIWTTDLNEKTVLSTQRGWEYEGVVGHVIP
jgi:hypothetical protein